MAATNKVREDYQKLPGGTFPGAAAMALLLEPGTAPKCDIRDTIPRRKCPVAILDRRGEGNPSLMVYLQAGRMDGTSAREKKAAHVEYWAYF